MDWIIQLIAGAVGGNLTGGIFKKLSLGTLGNSLAGIFGGGLGGQIMGMLGGSGATGDSSDMMGILRTVLTSGVGGGGLMAIIGLVKKMMAK